MSKNFTQVLYSYISNNGDTNDKVIVEEWLSTVPGNKEKSYTDDKIVKQIWSDVAAHVKLTLPEQDY
jgi:hypothetical protein